MIGPKGSCVNSIVRMKWNAHINYSVTKYLDCQFWDVFRGGIYLEEKLTYPLVSFEANSGLTW